VYLDYLFHRQIFLGPAHIFAAVVVHYLDVLSEPRDDFSRRASAMYGEGGASNNFL
jgi:hypothetical protein